jgi:hypothetical protein
MTTTPYELLARFATDGTIAGVSVRYLTTINGKVYEGDPQPLASVDDPAFNEFADQFSAAVVAERDELAEEVESLTESKQAADASVEQLTAQVATLANEKATLTQQVAAANARITALLTEVPYDPRVIEASAFINRTTPEEMLQLFGSQDPNVQAIARMLLAYKANDWRIELDSVDMQQAVGYLQLVGLVCAERAAALLRDGTRAESYVADGST